MMICLSVATYSIYNIVKWKIEANKTNNNAKNILKNADLKSVSDSKNTEIINQDEDIDKSSYYWKYINMNMLNVDIKKLKETNKDIIGWVKVDGTNVNYPFVQTSNNSYYLTHSIDKSYNTAGWVFLDYRNQLTNNTNTIIYAHGRVDKTMFGSLKNVLSKSFLKNKNNYVIKISTENENSLWQIFSAYHIPTTNDYLVTEFSSDTKYQIFLDMIKERSSYDFDTSVKVSDKILTLSTCYNKTDKMVVHAKLIKKETK